MFSLLLAAVKMMTVTPPGAASRPNLPPPGPTGVVTGVANY